MKIKDINLKPDTLNLIEERLGNSHEHITTGDSFMNKTPVLQALSSTVNKWYIMKLKNFCKAMNHQKDKIAVYKIEKGLHHLTEG